MASAEKAHDLGADTVVAGAAGGWLEASPAALAAGQAPSPADAAGALSLSADSVTYVLGLGALATAVSALNVGGGFRVTQKVGPLSAPPAAETSTN